MGMHAPGPQMVADLPELGNTGLAESFSKLNLFSEENGTNNKKKLNHYLQVETG